MKSLDVTRVLIVFALSTSACLVEPRDRDGWTTNDPDDPNCSCPAGGGGRTGAQPSDFDLTGVTEIVIDGFDGTIDLDAEASKPSIGWTKRGDVTVSIDRKGSTLGVHAKKPSLCGSCGIDYEVHVPSGLDVRLTTSNGEIHCRGAVRDLTATTSNGKVGLVRVSGRFDVTTSNGAIVADDLTPNGDCTLSTSNGGVTIRQLRAKLGTRVEGTTSNGDICVSLDGFTIEKTKDHFIATSCGENTGSLVIETSNAGICVSD